MARLKVLTAEQEQLITRMIELRIPKTVISRHFGVSNSVVSSVQNLKHITPLSMEAITSLIDYLSTSAASRSIIFEHEQAYTKKRIHQMATEAEQLERSIARV